MICPHCGEPVEASAQACPSCGSDAETGWSEEGQIQRWGVALPMDDAGYREVVAELEGRPVPRGSPWRIIAAVLGLMGMTLLLLRWLP